MYFTINQTTALTGLDFNRLRYLQKSCVVVPYKLAREGYSRKLSRYSWDQLLELRAIASLPKGTLLRTIRALQNFLEQHRGDSRLSRANILILGKDFYLAEPSELGLMLIKCLGNSGQIGLNAILLPNPQSQILATPESKVLNLESKIFSKSA